ncbi:MAG: hypothetical protein HRU01_28315 [Myxococcales bacterium]|nr:hypothetical protein [Myxococcales bacterium]
MSEPPPAGRCRRNPPIDLAGKIKFGEKLLKWFKKGHILGPFHPDDHILAEHGARVNPVFQRFHNDGSSRPLVNCSKELDDGGLSLNDIIREGPRASVEYIKVRELIATMLAVGPECWIWVKDLDEGYYNCRVRPEQCWLLAFQFAGLVFVPMVLSMGLSSAPLIFTIFMSYVVKALLQDEPALNFIEVPIDSVDLKNFGPDSGIEIIADRNVVRIPLIKAYVDDIFGFATKATIHAQYHAVQRMLRHLGLNAQPSKDRRPAPTNIMLGVEYDVVNRCCRTPRKKALEYVAFANKLLERRRVGMKELFSLCGKCRHIAAHCKVLSAFARGVEARCFAPFRGRPINWSHTLPLRRRLRSDIELMRDAMIHSVGHNVPWRHILGRADDTEFNAFTDAAGVHGGIGGYLHQPKCRWFQIRWTAVSLHDHCDIMWMEMAAIYVLLKCNVEQLRGRHVGFYCDNEPVVWMLIKGRSSLKRPDLQLLIREISRICHWNGIEPWWEHIAGDDNVTADRLSRFLGDPFGVTNCQPIKNTNLTALVALKLALQQSAQFAGHIDHKYLVGHSSGPNCSPSTAGRSTAL